MKSPLKILSMSDLHLGHRLVPTVHNISNLNRALPDSPKMLDIDILIIAGDVTDEALALSDDDVGPIQMWIIRTLRLCKKWDITLFVLEGTPLHDRRQSKQFVILNEANDIQADLHYVDALDIKHFDKFGIDVLFIPDEWRGDNEQTKEEVRALMRERGLTTVDYAVMHGMFPHQLPDIKHMHVHDTEFYLSIVRKYIFIGHVHQMSQYEKIIAHGSHERLAHNEEHAKGMFFVESHNDGFLNDRVVFRINERAARFVSVSIIGLSKLDAESILRETIEKVEKNNADYLIPVFVRVICEKNDPNEDVFVSYKKSYALVKWSHKHVSIKVEQDAHTVPVIYKPVPINENTIVSLIKNRLVASGVDEPMLLKSLDILNKMKEV